MTSYSGYAYTVRQVPGGNVGFQQFCTILKCIHDVILSLHFNGHFSDGPGLASTRMPPFWILLELKVMEVVVTTGAINRCAKLQLNRYHQQTNTQLCTGRKPFLSPNPHCQSTESHDVIEFSRMSQSSASHFSHDRSYYSNISSVPTTKFLCYLLLNQPDRQCLYVESWKRLDSSFCLVADSSHFSGFRRLSQQVLS